MKQKSSTHHSNQSGAIFVLFAVTFAFLMAFSAIAVDMAYIYAEKEQLQNAADAGGLAGANKLNQDITDEDIRNTITDETVDNYVNQNSGNASVTNYYALYDASNKNIASEAYKTYNDSSKKINVLAVYSPVTSSTGDKTIYVELRRRIPTHFFKYFGFSDMPVVVSAKAYYKAGSSSSIKNPFNTGPFNNAAIYAGWTNSQSPTTNDVNNSIDINVDDQKNQEGVGITGDIYTNGKINLNWSGMVKVAGNIYSPYATSAKKDNPVFSNTYKWNSSGVNFTGNYGFSNIAEYNTDYTTSTESAMEDVNAYLNSIISTAVSGVSDSHDGNQYMNNNHTIYNENLQNEYSTSIGEQIYYINNDKSSPLTVNMEKQYINTNTATNSTTNTAMFDIGDTSGVYGYNIIIANGNINASTTIANSSTTPVILISLNGNISLQNDYVPFYGVVYAPNGTVKIDGHNNLPNNYKQTNNPIYGSIVAKQVKITSRGTAIYHETFSNFGSSSSGSSGTSSPGTVTLIDTSA